MVENVNSAGWCDYWPVQNPDHEDASIRFAFGSARILELCWQSSLAEPAISGARHELTTWLAEQFLASLDETRCHLFFTVFGCI